MKAEDLRRLAMRTSRGDSAAADALCRHFEPRLTRYFVKHAMRSPDVEDLVQETLTQALARLREGGAPLLLDRWILTIARNLRVGFWRRERMQPVYDTAAVEKHADDRPTFSRQEEELWESFLRALDELPERYRSVLIWSHVDGLSRGTIAKRLGMNPNAASALLFRARQRLMEALPEGT